MDHDSHRSSKPKVAIITGGAKNIGLAIAKKLGARGYSIVVNTKADVEAGENALAELSLLAPAACLVVADVSTEDGARQVINLALEKYGRVDILVNNAGPFLLRGIADMTLDEWRRMIDGNLTSAFLCSREAIPAMRGQGEGQVIFIGAPRAGLPLGAGAYGIAKTGVVLLARYIAKTEGKHGIRANVVNPGFIRTSNYTDEMICEMEAMPALGRLGAPDDIASAVAFLTGPDASYISGAVLDVGGGLWV